MPSQLVNNDAVYFICARNFTYAGVDYKIGEEFDQDIAVGQIDLLVRTRRLFAVVDNIEDKPRHWHHHIWLRSEVSKKLGVLNNSRSTNLTGESLYNRYTQIGLPQPSWDYDPVTDVGRSLLNTAKAAASTEETLKQENEEGKYSDENRYIDTETGEEETEPQSFVHPEEVEDDEEERVITEEDLFDPSEHGVPEVVEYLDSDITAQERQRVLEVEKANKARVGVLKHE